MPDRYVDAIIKSLPPATISRSSRGSSPGGWASRRRTTARSAQAIKRLRDSGRVVLGAKDALTLPEIGDRVRGIFRANPRGFGFIVPETPNSHGDLFVPEDATGGAMTGDLVVATVRRRGKRDGQGALRRPGRADPPARAEPLRRHAPAGGAAPGSSCPTGRR